AGQEIFRAAAARPGAAATARAAGRRGKGGRGIRAGYEDQNDHDTLRTDPVFKLIAGRSPQDDDLASQPTLSRFENQINLTSLKRLREVFVEQFIASFAQPPLSLTFDLDAVDDPTHGAQQLSLFHGFYEQNDLLPRRPGASPRPAAGAAPAGRPTPARPGVLF